MVEFVQTRCRHLHDCMHMISFVIIQANTVNHDWLENHWEMRRGWHLWCENPSHGGKLIFWVIGVMWNSMIYPLSRTIYLNLLWYWYQKSWSGVLMFKGIKNKEKHKNYLYNFLYFAVLLCATCDGFSQFTSHLEIRFVLCYIKFY